MMIGVPELPADPLTSLADLVRARRDAHPSADHSFVVTIDGAVSVGKSTTASMLASLLAAPPDALVVHTASTDGYLYANAVLAARGLTMHKGFPDSYDREALLALLQSVRAGAPELHVRVYSHETYDVLEEPEVFARPQVLVLEGLHTTTFLHGVADLTVYVDADESDIERWYVERFVALVQDATDGFYARFRGWGDDDLTAFAGEVWDSINAPNLRENILPGRARADVVLTKGPDHAVTDLRLQR